MMEVTLHSRVETRTKRSMNRHPRRWASLGMLAFAFATAGCDDNDFTVPHNTLACMESKEYSALLHKYGSVRALNASAAAITAKFPLCTVLHAGEVVSIVLGKPGEEAVMIIRKPANNDPALPSYLRSSPLTYWANF